MDSTFARTLPRKHIVDALFQAVSEKPLVVLTAPMGYGKSTIIRELAGKFKKRALYINLPPEPNTPHLWEVACLQLSAQGAKIGSLLHKLGPPNDSVVRQHVFETCRKMVGKKRILLLIDDYHFINSPEVDSFIENLVRERIPNLSIVLAGRNRPNLGLEDLRLKGYATFFGQDQFAFSQEEARSFFALHGVDDDEAADAAWEFSEGWAAALWLSLQSYLEHGVVKPIRDIDALITETIFSTYTPEEQQLLVSLSFLGAFTPAQAAEISGDQSAPAKLQRLYVRNAFLRYSSASGRYQIHDIFLNYLKRCRENRSHPACAEIDRISLLRKAAACSVEDGDYIAAIRFFHEAGEERDNISILKLFERQDKTLFIRFGPDEIAGIIDDIPWEQRKQCPLGYLGFVHSYMARIDGKKGSSMLKEAEQELVSEEIMPGKDLGVFRAEVELMHSALSFNDFEKMSAHCEKAYELSPTKRSVFLAPQMSWTFNCPHGAFLYLREVGGYQDLMKLVEDKLCFFQTLTGASVKGPVALFKSELLLETGDFLEAGYYLQKAKLEAEDEHNFFGKVAVEFTSARLRIAQGERHEAYSEVESLTRVILDSTNPYLLYSLDLCRSYIAGVLDKTSLMPQWLFKASMTEHRGFYQGMVFALTVRAKGHLKRKEWVEAEHIGEILLERSKQFVFGRLHGYLLLACAAQMRGRPQSARELLSQAVEIARPDGLVTSIAEYGREIFILLGHLQEFHPEDAFIARLIKLTRRFFNKDRHETLPITARELEILRMVAAGDSSKKIADSLGITAGSVANTLSRMYIKLGVKNRVEAVKKLKEHEDATG